MVVNLRLRSVVTKWEVCHSARQHRMIANRYVSGAWHWLIPAASLSVPASPAPRLLFCRTRRRSRRPATVLRKR